MIHLGYKQIYVDNDMCISHLFKKKQNTDISFPCWYYIAKILLHMNLNNKGDLMPQMYIT